MCGVHWEAGVDKECVLEVVNSLVWCAFIRKAMGGVDVWCALLVCFSHPVNMCKSL